MCNIFCLCYECIYKDAMGDEQFKAGDMEFVHSGKNMLKSIMKYCNLAFIFIVLFYYII